MDKFSKRHRTLLLARPHQEAYALTIWSENSMENRLNMLYFARDDSNVLENGTWRAELHHVQYQVPANDAEIGETGIQMRSWQSIAFPCGDSYYYACLHTRHKPPAIVLSSRVPPGQHPTDVRVLVFDLSLGMWSMVTPDRWMAMLRDDNASWNVIRAAEEIRPLSGHCPSWRCLFDTPISNLLDYLHQSVDSTGSVYFTGVATVLQFSSKPPSLKRLAAESLCAGNRAFNRAELKNAIGFDIFDGMARSNDKPNWPVIYV